MKKLLLLFLLLCTYGQLIAQQTYTVEGNVKNDLGNAMGVTITVKGTDISTTTDHNGWYRLRVPANATLVFSQAGMRTQELKVVNGKVYSQTHSYKISEVTTKSSGVSRSKKGVAVLSDWTPSSKIKRRDKVISPTESWRFGWVNRSEWQVINRLPRLQSLYAQGRPVNGVAQWQGAETGEQFSWGPTIASLSFDNSTPYSYDQNGRLTTANTGQAARAYQPLSFLRNGASVYNKLMATKRLGDYQYLNIYASDQRSNDLVPNAYSRKNQIHASLSQRGAAQVFVTYTNQRQELPLIGASWQNILGSVFATPPTFDQANGLSRQDALNNANTYTLANGSPRSPAPTLLDNPYGLVTQQPNYNQESSMIAGLAYSHRLSKRSAHKLYYQLGFNSFNQTYETGVLPNTSAATEGRWVKREANNQHLSLTVIPRVKGFYLNKRRTHRLYIGFPQEVHFYQQGVNRTNAENFLGEQISDLSQAQQVSTLQHKQSRWAYKVSPIIKFFSDVEKKGILSLKLSNQFYTSSTLKNNQHRLFLPQASVAFTYDIPYAWSLKLSASHQQSLRETPLVNNQWDYNSTQVSVANYRSYYPSQELLQTNQLNPEHRTVWQTGIYLNLHDKWKFKLRYKHETTQNLLIPTPTNNGFEWANVGTLRKQVWQASAYVAAFRGQWKHKLNWELARPVMHSLNNGEVALAGYQDAGRRLVAGQPYGVLYGSRYLRNANGQVVIDGQGFPIKDSTLGVLGNPNPTWTMRWNSAIKLKRFELQWVLSYQHGGDRWNGTQAMLDYLGTSQQSADLRNTRGYVFAGVNQAGQTNQTAVDFANPANGLVGNRWVRYGAGGVTEDYIEQGSMLRLDQVKITYDMGLFLGWLATNAQISVFAHNLLLFSPYSGLDPNSTLMNTAAGQGLDLFNAPGTTSFGVEFRLIF